jgi:hypothetical protein
LLQLAAKASLGLLIRAQPMSVTMLDMTDGQPHRRSARVQRAGEGVSPQPTSGPHADSVLAAEEYQSLRAEVIARIQKQQDIMNFAILVITVLLTYAGFTKSGGPLNHAIEILGAPASLALSVFALMTLDHEMNIAHATKYIYEDLRDVWINAIGATGNALLWNRSRARWQQYPGWPRVVLPTTVAAAKYYAITCLNLVLVIFSWIEYASHMDQYNELSLGLIALATTLLILTLVASAYTSSIWLSMRPEENAPDNSGGNPQS